MHAVAERQRLKWINKQIKQGMIDQQMYYIHVTIEIRCIFHSNVYFQLIIQNNYRAYMANWSCKLKTIAIKM